MKIKNFVIALSVASILTPVTLLSATAGVDKQLVEVNEAQRLREEQERIRAQEEYRKAAEAQRQATLAAEARAKEAEARAREAEARAKAAAAQTQPVVERQTTSTAANSFNSNSDEDRSIFLRILGATVGLPVAAVTGIFKGGLSKGNEMADTLSDKWDVSTPTEIAGDVAGGLAGGVTGAVTGLLDGAITGVKTGWDDPFSAESFLWDSRITDYDPFDIGAD